MIFYLPDRSNNITQNDLSTGILRITVSLKPNFPEVDTFLCVVINDMDYKVRYTKRKGRSDLLHLGKDLLVSLVVGKKCKLKFTRLTATKYIIENEYFLFLNSETDNITYSQLKDLKEKYWHSLKNSSFPPPPNNGSCVDMIKYFKRKSINNNNQIGPYFGLTVFEAANRIATDLVIINGIIQLISNGDEPESSVITVRLGNKDVKGKGDFSINEKEGEAFNVAASYYKGKLRSTNSKWQNLSLSYILVNAEVFEELKKEKPPIEVIKVIDWG